MRRLIFALTGIVGLIAVAAQAQVTTRGRDSNDAVTPQAMTQRLEALASRIRQQGQRVDRAAQVDVAWPIDLAEYQALGKFAVVLVTAVSQNTRELPLRQVYVRANGSDIVLKKLSSRRSAVTEGAIRSILGAYREDSFYLAPAGPLLREGLLLIDFAVNRKEFRLIVLPLSPPDFVSDDPNPDPAKDAIVAPQALRTLIEREYPGFVLSDLSKD